MTNEIRFIDPNYNELFRVPNGSYITVTRDMAAVYPGTTEEWLGKCTYIDDYHVDINGECYHICQFAEMQARLGSQVRPEPNPETVARYLVTHRIFVGDKIYKMGDNPNAVQRFATWRSRKADPTQNDWGHYWHTKATAWSDLLCRANAECTGIPYDHTKRYNKEKNER